MNQSTSFDFRKNKSYSNDIPFDDDPKPKRSLAAVVIPLLFVALYYYYDIYVPERASGELRRQGEEILREMQEYEAQKEADQRRVQIETHARRARLLNADSNAASSLGDLRAQHERWTDKDAPLRLRSEENADWSVDAETAAARKAGTRRTLTLYGDNPEDDVELAFRWIPAGTFLYGSPLDEPGRSENEVVQRQETVERGFWLLETETTERIRMRVERQTPDFEPPISRQTGDDPYLRAPKFRSLVYSFPAGARGWDDALEICRQLNELDGKPAGLKFRLPSEIEWERACRAGASTPYDGGAKPDVDAGNFLPDSLGSSPLNDAYFNLRRAGGDAYPANVARFKPNAWGLYDMRGNAAEICGLDPNAPPISRGAPPACVLRGGSYASSSVSCRSASRSASSFFSNDFSGFRLALVSDDETSEADDDAEPESLETPEDAPGAE